MKKVLLLTIIIFTFNTAYSQLSEHKFSNDTLYLKQGGIIVKKQSIKIGRGSKDDGSFRFIEVNEGSMFRGVNRGGTNYGLQEANAMLNKYNDATAEVVRFEDRGNRKTGYKTFVIIAVGDVRRYQVDINNAIDSGEIIIPGSKVKSQTKETGYFSLADEIKKLNELKEQGLISEQEYDKLKSKLLE